MSAQTPLQESRAKYERTESAKRSHAAYYLRTKAVRQEKMRAWRNAKKARFEEYEKFFLLYKESHPEFLFSTN